MFFGERTLKRQLSILSMVGYVAVVMVLLFLDYYQIFNHYERMERDNEAFLSSYIEIVDRAVDLVDQTALHTYNANENFQVVTYTTDHKDKYSGIYSLIWQLEQQMQVNYGLSGAIIFYDQGKSRRYTFYDGMSYEDKMIILEQTLFQLNQSEQQKNGFFVLTEERVYYVRAYTRRKASIACVTDLTKLWEDYAGSENDRELILTTGQVVLYGQKLLDQTGIVERGAEGIYTAGNESGYRLYEGVLRKGDVKVCMAVKEDTFWKLKPFHALLIFITIFVVLFVVIIYRFLRRQILNPLKELTISMEDIRERKRKRLDRLAPYLEFDRVTDTFNSMMDEIEQLKIRSYESQLEQQEVQLQCFSLQLRPHFYLNCLKTLNYMAISKDTENMQQLIYTISKQMRYLLQNAKQLVTVAEEVENVKGYISLQQMISSRSVECSIQIEPELMDCQIPILCIQTFVENSCNHAQVRAGDALEVSIRGIMLVTDQGRMIDISVEDNGSGYEEEMLKVINSEKEEAGDGRAIGIRNVMKRCRLLYGKEAECMFYNMTGAVSELILPYREELMYGNTGD